MTKEPDLPKKRYYYIALMNPGKFTKGVITKTIIQGMLGMAVTPSDFIEKAVDPVRVTTDERYFKIIDKLDQMLKAKSIIDYYRAIDPVRGDICLLVCCDDKSMMLEVKKLEKTVEYI